MTKRESILVSACLLGEACRYDGKSQPCEAVRALAGSYDLVPACPEQLGGLPTPRTPSEIQPDGRVVDRAGTDHSEEFATGAWETLRTARMHSCTRAVLKSKSPSCGVHEIYDGTFTGTIIPGKGVTATLLHEADITLFDENDLARKGANFSKGDVSAAFPYESSIARIEENSLSVERANTEERGNVC